MKKEIRVSTGAIVGIKQFILRTVIDKHGRAFRCELGEAFWVFWIVGRAMAVRLMQHNENSIWRWRIQHIAQLPIENFVKSEGRASVHFTALQNLGCRFVSGNLNRRRPRVVGAVDRFYPVAGQIARQRLKRRMRACLASLVGQNASGWGNRIGWAG